MAAERISKSASAPSQRPHPHLTGQTDKMVPVTACHRRISLRPFRTNPARTVLNLTLTHKTIR